MAAKQYALLDAQDGSDVDAEEAAAVFRKREASPPSRAVSRIMSLMCMFGMLYIAVSFVFSLFPKPKPFVPPAFPDYYTMGNANDLYAKQHRLSTDFARESWTMTEAQCDAAFHPLWTPLYDSKAKTDSQGGHTLKRQMRIEKEEAAPRELTCLKIVNNQLYLTDFHHMGRGSRTEAGISLLERAVITSTERLPNVRFCLSTQDLPTDGTFANTKRANQDVWLAPEFGFWAWPEPGIGSYVGFRQRANALENSIGGWTGKVRQLFWRGALWIGEERRVLADITKDAAWANVHNIDWGGPKADGVHPDFYETIEGHCKYAYLASPEGISYSGRLKYILNCESVIFMRTVENLVHFSHLLDGRRDSELQNVVLLPPRDGDINKSWLNAEAEVAALLRDDKKARRIAARSVEAFRDRFISPAAVACYWRKALRIWESSQQYNVTLDGSEVAWETFTSQFFQLHIPIT